MFKKSNIVILSLIFVWSCSIPSTNIQIASDSIEIKTDKLVEEDIQDLSGIQFFMDGMMFMEQGEYSRAIIS